jgi:hypothetical protein
VYVYQRPDAASDFVLFRKLDASNVKPDDRLGHGVAVHAGVIVATSLQKINPSSVRYQRSVQVVEVQAARCCTGNTYRLGWRESCSDSSSSSSSITHTINAAAARLTSSSSSSSSSSGCRTVWSEPIQTDATAATVKATLEAAFGLGLAVTDELYVTRSAKDPITDGYTYTIVFIQHESDVPQLLVDYSVMTGPGATVTVTTVNEVPDRLRGVAHVFQVSISLLHNIHIHQHVIDHLLVECTPMYCDCRTGNATGVASTMHRLHCLTQAPLLLSLECTCTSTTCNSTVSMMATYYS